ncbi:TIM barrel protein [bacterium]|nr:TIM barrel protein [bacterium]
MPVLTRRSFLASGAASVLVLSGWRRAVAKESSSRMTLGFSTYGMKSLKTEAAIETISEIGYDAVELTVWPGWDCAPDNVSAERRRTIRQLISGKSLKLTSLMEHLYPSPDDAEHAAGLQRLEKVYQLARDLAGEQRPVVQTVLGGGTWDEQKGLFRDRVGDWISLGQKHGIVTCIKPHRGGGMSQPSEAIWLIQQLDNSPWLRMVYDYSHYAYRGIDLVESVRAALPYTAHVAVKDAVEQDGKVRFELPGTAGTIDFVTLLKELDAGGYRGDISCEVSGMVSGKPGYEPLPAAKTCYRNMAAAFQSAGVARA